MFTVVPAVVIASFALFSQCTGSNMCTTANWWISFDHAGLSSCPTQHPYITGLERSRASQHDKDYIYHIEGAQCCRGTENYGDQSPQCQKTNWVHSFDRTNHWNMCPNGYFLSGLERSGDHYLHNIEYGRCCKPSNSPIGYRDCYKANVWNHFDHDNQGMFSCGRFGYYITGIYRSNCDLVYCIEEFMCCSMQQ